MWDLPAHVLRACLFTFVSSWCLSVSDCRKPKHADCVCDAGSKIPVGHHRGLLFRWWCLYGSAGLGIVESEQCETVAGNDC
jgi:hypothetical protein